MECARLIKKKFRLLVVALPFVLLTHGVLSDGIMTLNPVAEKQHLLEVRVLQSDIQKIEILKNFKIKI